MTTGKERKLRRLPQESLHELRVESVDGGYRVGCEEPRFEGMVSRTPSGAWSVLGADGASHEVLVEREEEELRVVVGQRTFRFAPAESASKAAAGGTAGGRAEVKAPMPGKVVKLLVTLGESVTAGQGVLLFEAMKMQNEIRAPKDGVVSELSVTEGDAVEARAKLFLIE